MISDVPCEPVLPPELMISGTNSATTAAFSISPSKYPIAVAVSISPRNSAASQPPRFFTISQNPTSKYGLSSASEPPSFWISSVALLLGEFQHIIVRDDAEHVAVGIVDHRQRDAVVLLETP